MLKYIFTLCAALASMVGGAHNLLFNESGKFKIVQITDVHFKNGNAASDVALELFDEIIENEKPDLVVFTGDIVVEPAPVIEGWKKVIAPFQKAQIPMAIVLGNHDDEHNSTREEINSFLMNEPYCLVEDEDYVLEIEGKESEKAALLYMFDSNSYSTLENVSGYGWFSLDQIQNYVTKSKSYTEMNNGEKIPSLAFFHIPLPEYSSAYNNKTFPAIGFRGEEECPPKINTGMFAAMVEMGDVMGCFVGHDHVNDYIAYQNDIALAYGRFSGGKTTYGDLTNGCRVIILEEGQRKFTSYIRERGGNVLFHSEYPRKLRFAVTADTHFDMPPETDQYKNVMALNKLQLDGVSIVGDVFDRQHPSVIELFKLRYEKNRGVSDSTLNANLYIGLGNHDINPVSSDEKQNLLERNLTLAYTDSLLLAMKSEGLIKNMHAETRNYSFELNGVHFVQTHTFAGDTTLGEGGLQWLKEDLKKNAAKGKSVVLLMHYTFTKSERWITNTERYNLAEALKGYNIKAIFNGHDHVAKNEKWNGIEVFTADNVWKDDENVNPSFYLIEYDKIDGMEVKQCFWDNDTNDLTIKLIKKL
ncbi:MAG: metallophosphoesterase [Rikenellaceae bacterium]